MISESPTCLRKHNESAQGLIQHVEEDFLLQVIRHLTLEQQGCMKTDRTLFYVNTNWNTNTFNYTQGYFSIPNGQCKKVSFFFKLYFIMKVK